MSLKVEDRKQIKRSPPDSLERWRPRERAQLAANYERLLEACSLSLVASPSGPNVRRSAAVPRLRTRCIAGPVEARLVLPLQTLFVASRRSASRRIRRRARSRARATDFSKLILFISRAAAGPIRSCATVSSISRRHRSQRKIMVSAEIEFRYGETGAAVIPLEFRRERDITLQDRECRDVKFCDTC